MNPLHVSHDSVVHLLIDRGNTYSKLATVVDGQMSEISLHKDLSPEVIEEKLSAYSNCAIEGILCSVAHTPDHFTDFLKERLQQFLVVGPHTVLPLAHVQYDRSKIGADRLALAVGARELFPDTNCLIVDIGTAITYDVVDAAGCYLGGDITPGPKTRSKSLHNGTARLPEISIFEHTPQKKWGNNTEEAIINGIVKGICFEIEGYITTMREQYLQCITIITGGYSPFFVNRIKYKTFACESLLMIGLESILKYNYETTP